MLTSWRLGIASSARRRLANASVGADDRSVTLLTIVKVGHALVGPRVSKLVSTKRGRFGRIPRTGTSRSDRHQSPRFTGHRHQRRSIAEAPQERLSQADGGNVFAHVQCAPGQCAKPSRVKVSRTLHAAYSRTVARDALRHVPVRAQRQIAT